MIPSSAQARTLLGISSYGAQQYSEAIKYLEPAAQADPGNMELHQLLAQSCLQAKNYSCATEQFRLLLNQNSDSGPAHILLGEALDGLGRTQEAISEFEAAAKISPNEPDVYFSLGYLHWKSQQYDEARQEFDRELKLDPNHAQALAYLGDIEWKDNHPDDAVRLLQRAVKANKDLRIAYVDLGTIYLQQKSYKDAQVALQKAIALEPNQPDAHYQLGRLYQATGKAAEAKKELQKVRELHEKADSLVGKIPASPPSLNSTEPQ